MPVYRIAANHCSCPLLIIVHITIFAGAPKELYWYLGKLKFIELTGSTREAKNFVNKLQITRLVDLQLLLSVTKFKEKHFFRYTTQTISPI